ncbi:hypothetical protein [Actinocorallia sp. A-T 12471]|uniref:hypothetical protein n=1 Tax=Actinocorallia sp. A-T 12471 TaxID=3089813 RepID=UPI0029D386B6|nr:hypothetical protein [Actinocorallia sp. A-T 12471]MDX6738527.1 hypothetical protein [Actinocorallia sp. A-T 12471]
MAQRAAGAVGTVAVAALVNLATGMITDHRAVVWWVSGFALIVVGVIVQWWLPVTAAAGTGTRQTAKGNVVGGSLTQTARGNAVQDASDNQVTGDLNQNG